LSIEQGRSLLAELTGGRQRIEWVLCIDNAEPQPQLVQAVPALARAYALADCVCYTGAARSGAAKGRNICFEQVSGRWMYPIDGDDRLLANHGVIRRLSAIMDDEGLGSWGFIGCTQDLLFTGADGGAGRLVPGAQSLGTVPWRDVAFGLSAAGRELTAIWGQLGFSPFHTGNIIWNVERLEELRGAAPWHATEVSENTEMIMEYSQHIDGLFLPGLAAKAYRCDERPTVTVSEHYLANRDAQQRELGQRLGVEVGGVPTIGGVSITKSALERIEADAGGRRQLALLRGWAAGRG
jgi:hypothetical protein